MNLTQKILILFLFAGLFLPSLGKSEVGGPPAPPTLPDSSENIRPIKAEEYLGKVCAPEAILEKDGKYTALVQPKGFKAKRISGKLVSSCILADFGAVYKIEEVRVVARKITQSLCGDVKVKHPQRKVGLRLFYRERKGEEWRYGGLVRWKQEGDVEIAFRKRVKNKKLQQLLICRWAFQGWWGDQPYDRPNLGVDGVWIKIKGQVIIPPPPEKPLEKEIIITSPEPGDVFYTKGAYFPLQWKAKGTAFVRIFLVPQEEGYRVPLVVDEEIPGMILFTDSFPAFPGKFLIPISEKSKISPGKYYLVVQSREPIGILEQEKVVPPAYDKVLIRFTDDPKEGNWPPPNYPNGWEDIRALTFIKVKIYPSWCWMGIPLGEKVTLRAWVGNASLIPAENVKVKIKITRNDGESIEGERTIKSILPFRAKRVTFRMRLSTDWLLQANPNKIELEIIPPSGFEKAPGSYVYIPLPVLPWTEPPGEVVPFVVALSAKNAPPSGNLSLSPEIVRPGKIFKIKVEGKDPNGMWEVRIWRPFNLFQPGSWWTKVYKKSCSPKKTTCKKTWRGKFKKVGDYKLCGAVIGIGVTKKGKARLEGRYTNPKCVILKVRK